MTDSNTQSDVVALADRDRVEWIRTILALTDTEANRRAFLAGYNLSPCPHPVTKRKAERWKQGLAVHDRLKPKRALRAKE